MIYTLQACWHDLKADVIAYKKEAQTYSPNKNRWWNTLSALLIPSVITCLIYRISHWLYCKKWVFLSNLFSYINKTINQVNIAPSSRIGGGLYIPHTGSVLIEGHAGTDLKIYSGGTIYGSKDPVFKDTVPCIGNNVIIGAQACLVGPITIGDNVTIGFNSIVYENIASNQSVMPKKLRNYKIKS